MNKKSAKFNTAVLKAVLFAPVVASAFALGQTAQANATTPVMQPVQTIVLPGTGAPLLVTPEVHLSTVVPPVGASNATAGNTTGATNATATLPVIARDITAVPQYAGAGITVTITPALEETRGAAPSTPGVHLDTVVPSVGASSATPGNTAGATNATATLPVTPRVITAVPQYTVAGSTVMITPALEETRGAVPSTFDTGAGVAGMSGPAVGASTAAGTQQPSGGSVPTVAQPAANPPANPGVSQPTTPATNPPN